MERDGVRAQEIVRGLPRSFYERGTIDVARDLLGKVLAHGPTAGKHTWAEMISLPTPPPGSRTARA
jgi:hypothetical protein